MELVSALPDPPRTRGPFRLVGEIGRGGFGVVYLGRDGFGNLVAVKVLRRDASSAEAHDTTLKRFHREVDFLKQFEGHPRVPGFVFASDPQPAVRADQSEPWYATRYVPGPSLQAVVDEFGPLPHEAVLHLAVHLADVMGRVHRIGTHRDLKPLNVLLTVDGGHVVDFGLAHLLGAPKLTQAAVIASFEYVAPERLTWVNPADPDKADMYTLGGTLLCAATGRPPYPGADYRSRMAAGKMPVLKGVKGGLKRIIAACLQQDPRRRPTADEVVAAAQPLIRTHDFVSALGPDLAAALRAAADRVRVRWQPAHRPRRTAPQMPVRGPGVGWTRQVGDRVQTVTPTGGRIVVVTVGGAVVELRESDGEVVQRAQLPAWPTGAVAAFDDRVFVGDAAGGLHVIGAGEQVRIQLDGRVQCCVATSAGPVVATGGARLYGIDGRSTAIGWEATTAGVPVPNGLAWACRTVHVATIGGEVQRHHVADGEMLGRPHRVGHRIVAVAAHNHGSHVVAADGNVYALGVSADPVVPVPHPAPVRAGQVDGDVLVTCLSDGRIRAQDLKAPEPPFTWNTQGRIRRSLTVTRGLAVTGRVDGSLHVLHLATRQTRLWQVGDGCALEAPAAVTADETVVAGWADGTVSAFPRAM